jgi:hypothetical protein
VDECEPLVFGGSDGEGFRDELYVFNLSENKWRQIKKPETAAAASRQGLTLVHFSAQREHFLSHAVKFFAGLSDRNGSG